MWPVLLLALVAAATCSAQGAPVREEVNFSFGWRFHLGDVGARTSCGTIEHGVNYGIGGTEHETESAEACQALCCADANCVAWDWNPAVQQCWTKDNAEPKVQADRYAGTMPPAPPGPPPAAGPGFNDSSWEVVNCPHDALISQPFDVNNSPKEAFIARNVSWYRKSFDLPQEWSESVVYVYFEGSFHVSYPYVNGQALPPHQAGYTSFYYRLDNTTGIAYGSNKTNLLALFVDSSFGSGWWFESGGIFRDVRLISVNAVHSPPDRSWVYANVTGQIHEHTAAVPADGLYSDRATLHANVHVANHGPKAAGSLSVTAMAVDASEQVVGSGTASGGALASGAETVVPVAITIAQAELWSVPRPYLYTVVVEISADGVVVDKYNITSGIRTIAFTANNGLFLNNQNVKVRGFCDHSNFGGVGAAVPDRVNLFRTQALRSVGGNAWRMAHNCPAKARLDFMDRLGLLAMDENRDYGGDRQQGGSSRQTAYEQLGNMADLVQRDRSHPSVIIWSFCNEVGCNNESSAQPFRNTTYVFDGTRPVTQNHHGTSLSTDFLDVQGFSHKHGSDFDQFHKEVPDKPLMATECCSCFSQRGEDADLTPASKEAANATRPGLFYNNLIGNCTGEQMLYSDSRPFVAGTFVWSGFDYEGESQGWPQNVKCRGTIADVAGFPKETSQYLRAWWLSNINTTDPGRPPIDAPWTVFIVESWTPPKNGSTRVVHVYSNCPRVQLLLNGQPAGAAQAMPFFGTAEFTVAYAAGNLTAVGLDPAGHRLAAHSVLSASAPAALRLVLDAPSPQTGTGSALVADGMDTAMVRAEVVDSQGRVVPGASNTVTFRVLSGDGRVIGTHNGDPASQVNNRSPSRPAYHGLVRAFVRSTADWASPARHRRLLRLIDRDLPHSGVHVADPDRQPEAPPPPIVVQAEASGLAAAQLSIPLSTDLADLPIHVAQRSQRSGADTPRLL